MFHPRHSTRPAFSFPRAVPLLLGALSLLTVLAAATAGDAAAIETTGREAILLDADTGAVLLEKDADVPMPPASMSKLMTLYLVFERLKNGQLSLEDTLPVSDYAWEKGGFKSGSSTMALKPRTRAKVEDLLRGIIVQSGNDACIVFAEALAGSEADFAREMERKGQQIGLQNSHFRNATGWPDPEHRMTARDLATLALRIIRDFPEYYHYFAELEFTYNGIKQHNRNPLLYKNMGADGLKTGHTENAGYGLTASVKRNDRRLVLVVNGLESRKERAREPERLLEWGFRHFGNYALFKGGETVMDANVWLGSQGTVPLLIADDLVITLPRQARKNMKVVVRMAEPIPAPIAKGSQIATLVIKAPGTEDREIPLVAGGEVEQLGFVGRLGAALQYIVWGSSD
ncbi:MAG: D-alanyl-D-alanine carboxypeptidase [Hyphomicrobiales bacterium]|nr:D-alanyl-D-alanine carboxypeptidase [Hyphomicrobiales bacterium]